MIGLPKSTEFNKRIPKQKFYDNLTISAGLKRAFVEQIKIIYWRNKIAASTINLASGKTVTELEVFEIKLNSPSLDEGVLKQIDRGIPYHILFLLEYEGKYQAWIGYKEAASGNNAFKVSGYYHTEWLAEEALPLRADGLSIDDVYENFVKQIAGTALESGTDKSLKELVDRDDRRRKLQKQIKALQAKIRNEKQFNMQVQMNTELKKLKKALEELT